MLKAKVPRLDRKITLMQPVEVASTSGGPKYSGYENLDNDPEPYARIWNKLGNEVIQNDQITHVQQTIFTVRYREDINLNVKIVYNSKMYAILSFTESGETRRRFLDITAEYLKEYVIT
jgi:SPP1 family predicted phage head-tail adaptor